MLSKEKVRDLTKVSSDKLQQIQGGATPTQNCQSRPTTC